jgi:DNA processing protein
MQDAVSSEQQAWIALNMASLTWPALGKALAAYVSEADCHQRVQQHGFEVLASGVPGVLDKVAAVQQSQSFRDELEGIRTHQVTLLTLADADYPKTLRWIVDPPVVLYVRGQFMSSHQLAVAVIGSRNPSAYGKMSALRFSRALAERGYTVVSGLARGIDSLAHQGALQAGGQTLAVLGSGINVIYPPENRRLYERICSQGVVLSEFPFHTKPDRWNFPRRNRIISGLCLGTLVIEATANSGSLHTARHALDQGREVFAVPGRIDDVNSQGTNGLIKKGAKLVETIDDILEELPEAVRTLAQHLREVEVPLETHETQRTRVTELVPVDLNPQESQVLASLSVAETHIDTISERTQLPVHVVAGILLTLELRELVQQFPGKRFARRTSGTAGTFGERK